MRSLAALLVGLLLGALIIFSYYSFFPQAQKQIYLNGSGSVEPVFSPNSEDEMIDFLRSARESIDVEVYIFTNQKLADELIAARERGVVVRVILEPRVDSPNPNLQTMQRLRDEGIDARWASLGFSLTHSKFAVVDGKKVLVGSINWSRSALSTNREAAVIIEDEEVAREFAKIFEEDWKNAGAAGSG
ncbi:MAG: phospholipase D-like domain-containing protein [Candidatus Micrarchaeota archaeon]